MPSSAHPNESPETPHSLIRQRTRPLRFALLGGLMLVFVSLFGYQSIHYVRLLAFGETVKGTVIQKEIRGVAREKKRWVGYRFEAEKQRHLGTTTVSEATYSSLDYEDALPVTYLPGSPQINDYEGQLWSGLLMRLTSITLFGVIGGAAFAFSYFSKRSN